MESNPSQAGRPEAGGASAEKRHPDAKQKVVRGKRFLFEGQMLTAVEVRAIVPQFGEEWLRKALGAGDSTKAALIQRRHAQEARIGGGVGPSKSSSWRGTMFVKKGSKK
ncbi:MAG: hypothetical protein ACRC2H_04505 [Silanimonas sp.]